MAKNEVTIKGIVEPQAICDKITKRTRRRAKVLQKGLGWLRLLQKRPRRIGMPRWAKFGLPSIRRPRKLRA